MQLAIRVVPNAKKIKFVEEPGRLKIYLTAPATEGKANKLLLEALAEHFNTKKNRISIIKGEKSRNKVVEITSTPT